MAFSSFIPFGNRALAPRDTFFSDTSFDDALGRFRRDVDRIFNDFFGDSRVSTTGLTADRAFSPRVDVREIDNNIVVHAELPGVPKENVNVEVRDNNLIISGETKKEEDKRDTDSGWVCERRFGRFLRTIPLPVKVDSEKTNAKFSDGILEIIIPRAEEASGRHIDIQ